MSGARPVTAKVRQEIDLVGAEEYNTGVSSLIFNVCCEKLHHASCAVSYPLYMVNNISLSYLALVSEFN